MKATDPRRGAPIGFTAEDTARFYEAAKAAADAGELDRNEVASIRIDATRIDVTVRWRRNDGTEWARGACFCASTEPADVGQWVARVARMEKATLAKARRP